MSRNHDNIDIIEEVMNLYKARLGADGPHAIADLICDLGHYAEENGIDFLQQAKNGIAHWRAEKTDGTGITQFLKTENELKSFINENSAENH